MWFFLFFAFIVAIAASSNDPKQDYANVLQELHSTFEQQESSEPEQPRYRLRRNAITPNDWALIRQAAINYEIQQLLEQSTDDN